MRFSPLLIAIILCHVSAWSQGIPWFRNYTSEEYGAHNQNFDIVAADDGTVYVANFEGLLYYDNAQWRIIHTPGITRVTSLFLDSRGTLWAGGYNYIGRVAVDAKGSLYLRPTGHGAVVSGEVTRIWEKDGQVYMHVSDDSNYILGDSTITPVSFHTDLPDPQFSYSPSPLLLNSHINQEIALSDDLRAVATNGDGMIFTDGDGHELCRITSDNGLCSDNVGHISYNAHGLLWGATDNGIFAIAMPSVYSRFTAAEGLKGEVLSMAQTENTVYVGTSSGLFLMRENGFVPVEEISLACWQLQPQGDRLLTATSEGLFAVEAGQKVKQLTTASTLSVLTDGDSICTGEMDGVYLNSHDGRREKLWDIEKVVHMVRDDQGTLWLQSLYGRIWYMKDNSPTPTLNPQLSTLNSPTPLATTTDEIHTLVSYHGHVTPVAATSTLSTQHSTLNSQHSTLNPQLSTLNTQHSTLNSQHSTLNSIPYPLFSYADDYGLLWLTDNKGKSLYAMDDEGREEQMSLTVYPLMDYSVRTMMRSDELLWMGGDKGLNIVHTCYEEPALAMRPRLLLRSVLLHGDSIVWGGYGEQPDVLPTFDSHENHIVFTYAIDFPSLLMATQYHTRINGGNWSAWEELTYEEYSNLTYGTYRFEVQARDAYGRLSDIVGIDFDIMPPLYMRWYMLLLYAILLAAVVYALILFRLYSLEKDKHHLEAVVKERTQDLVEAQHELVRQEKMATVGKLTQGLIDRILNPLNYINNFAKLSENLVDDAKANIEEEKDNITPDTYDNTMDVLDMLRGNLQKVGEHGANTSNVLKAMEEMLKDRTGGQVDMSLNAMLRQNEQMLHNYYEKEIAEYHIATRFSLPSDEVRIKGNAELLSTTIMNLLRNAVYAVVKKAKRQSAGTPGGMPDYAPEVLLALTVKDGNAIITIRDNGIGIESTIIDRIFDPFFTTKTTGEASGVGLYISREVAQNHGGDITVKSEKNIYTEFTITIPCRPK